MNEVILEGKVLNIYEGEKDGFLYVTVSVYHDHLIDDNSIRVESIFRCVMTNKEKIKDCMVVKGDKVKINGYLKTDYKQTSGGNEHKKLTIYAKEIKIVEEKKYFIKDCRE